MTKFQLNSALDIDALSRDYAVNGRLQVRDIVAAESAEEIYKRLHSTDWWLTYNDGEQINRLPPEELRQITREKAAQIQQTVYRNAQERFQFLYNYFPLWTSYFSADYPPHPLFEIYEFINSEPFLQFARKLTGLEGIRWADGQGTLYRATHFLTGHTDEVPKEKRMAAYVLNFTKDWRTDWGGLLQFWDKNGDIDHAFVPTFNALNIFTIPANHSVSMVTPFSPGLRFSVTGWLRGDDPPGEFPAR